MQLIRSFDGCQINVRQDGPRDAPPVLLSHQLGGGIRSWDSLTNALSHRYNVIRFDTRGQGHSHATDAPYDIQMLGRDALAVLEAFRLDSVAFVGLSQGAMCGMWLAAHHPARIRRLVIANSTPFIPNKSMWDQYIATARTEGVAAIVKPMIESWLSPSFKERQPEQTQQAVALSMLMSSDGFSGNCAVLRNVDLRPQLPTISCPALVIAGAEDGPRGAASPMMAAAIPGAKLVTIDNAAHLTHLENPDAFNRAVVDFLTTAELQ